MTIPKRRVPFLISDDGSLVQKSWHEYLSGLLASGSVGTIASQNANNVNITGGTISGTTITGYVTTTTTVNGKALSGNITLGLASSDFANQGTTTTVLHGNAAGNPSFSAVVEADITLADNTTNNVATTKHGFAPKLPNDATKYLDGTGAYTVPAGTSSTDSFKTISVSGQSDIVADSPTDTLTIVAGSNVTLTTNAGTDTLTIAAAASGMSSGTSNPAQPAFGNNVLFYRTDLGLVIYYDGTRWLTSNQYTFDFTNSIKFSNGLSVSTVTVMTAVAALCPTYDFWMETFAWSTQVLTTNDGSKNWSVVLTKYAQTTQTTIVTGSTGTTPDTAGDIVAHQTAIGALLGTTTDILDIDITKVSTPGIFTLYGASVIGRLVIT